MEEKISKSEVLMELKKLKAENMYNQFAYKALEDAIRAIEAIKGEK